MSVIPGAPLLAQLDHAGLELDQRLRDALEVSASKPDISPEDQGFPDSYLTLALYRLNTTLTRIVDLQEHRYNLFHEYKLAPKCEAREVVPGSRLAWVLNEAIKIANPSKTIGVGHYLKAIVKLSLDETAGEAIGFPGMVIHNTFSVETLLWGLGYDAWTPVEDAPEVKGILAELDGRVLVDDVPYLLGLENDRLIFRPAPMLGSYALEATRGGQGIRSNIALMTSLKDYIGLVTPIQVLELEDLLNNAKAQEADYQEFFERNPHFLRVWDFREAFPHVYLTRDEDGPLVPDFVLLDKEIQRATLVDLKLPTAKPCVPKKNRERFSALVSDARAQLLEYRDWFNEKTNRLKMRDKFGMEIYSPKLGVIIGRQKDFESEYQRQLMQARNADIELVTYDDILRHAQRRIAITQSALR